MARGTGLSLGRGTRRATLGALVATGLFALAAWVLVQTIDRLTAHQSRRSFHDLALVTQGIADWRTTIAAMAATNLLPNRLEALPLDETAGARGDAWQAQARFWHPELGRFRIRYRATDAADCVATGGDAIFQGETLVLRGSLPLARLIAQDRAAGAPAARLAPAGFLDWLNAPGPEAPPRRPVLSAADPATLCYEARLPLAAVVDLPAVAPNFTHLLLAVDNEVRVQLATDRLALFELDRMPLRESLVQTFAQQSGVKLDDPRPAKLGEALEPVKTSVAGVDYLAYVRRFKLGDGPLVTAVALVPEAQIRSQVLRPPPMPLALFELAVLLLLTVTPVIKLRLIGESESLERLEVAALALGTLAAAAILALIVAFAIDVTARRGAVDDQLVTTANRLRDQFAEDMKDLVAPLRDARPVGQPCADGLPFATVHVPRIDRLAGEPDDPVPPRTVAQAIDPAAIRLPLVESLFLVDNITGRQIVGSHVVTCRADRRSPPEVGARLDVSERGYFRDAASGAVVARDATPRAVPARPRGAAEATRISRVLWWDAYRADAVRSQADGMVKTVLGVPAWFGVGPPPRPVPNAVAAVVAHPRSLTRPVLGEGQKFMVVDLDRPGLPVLYHSNPTRALVERFVDETPDMPVAQRIITRLRHEKVEKPIKFVADYDGDKQRFVAVALPRTSWALLVWRTSAEPERVALGAVNWSLTLWAALGILIGFTVWVTRGLGRALIAWRVQGIAGDRIRLRARHRVIRMQLIRIASRVAPALGGLARALFDWADPTQPRRLSSLFWIDPRRSTAYRRFFFGMLGVQVVLAVLLLALPAGYVWLALGSIVLTLVGLLWLHRQPLDPTQRVLTDSSERQFRRAFAAVVIGLAILPAAALYRDASGLAARARDYGEFQRRNEAFEVRTEALRDIARSFYPSVRAMVEPNVEGGDRGVSDPGWFRLPGRPSEGFTETVQAVASPNSALPRLFCRDCPVDPASRRVPPAATIEVAPRGRAADQPVQPRDGYYVGATDPDAPLAIDAVEWISIAFAAAGATALLSAIIGTIFSQLYGVGRPIESTPYPLFPPRRAGVVGAPAGRRNALDELELNAKTMIVDPPLFVQQTLFDFGTAFDLAAERFTPVVGSEAPNAAQPLTVFYNLELTLRHPERRLAALAQLERVVSRESVRSGKQWVVLLSDLSPLERLLQAYERDREELGDLEASTKAERMEQLRRNREDIRWSRLLEEFQTYIFETLPKLDVARRGTTQIRRRILNELAPLPENVIATLLPPGAIQGPMVRFTSGQSREVRKALLDARYGPAVCRWADELNAPSEAAAVDFLAQMLIEHYEQLWASSSRSERLLLYHLAHRRAISMAAINPLASLIRRGLVAMDPMPRLMNQSFEQFVRRAEKPERVAAWRADAPRGSWRHAAGPLFVVLPLGLIALVYVVIESGQPIGALLPLMAAAGPALLQTLGLLRRSEHA